jgi:hypothetical protein
VVEDQTNRRRIILKNLELRRQITLALLANPGFFTHGLPKFEDAEEAARWLSLDDYDSTDLGQTMDLSQKILGAYLDGLVDNIIKMGELDNEP